MSEEVKTRTYKTVGDCPIRADVYPVRCEAPAPVLVWIHGGALICGARRMMHPVLRSLCAAVGYTQVSIDYRLAPEARLPEIIEDVQDAFRWARSDMAREFAVNPDRVAVIGHSAGGYLALMTGRYVEPRPRALVSFYGYGDITAPWYSRPAPFYCQQPAVPADQARAAVGGHPISEHPCDERRGRFYVYCRQQGIWPKEVMGIDPDQDPVAFEPFCPQRNVDRRYPPTLLIHGTADTDVPYQQSADMASALEREGVPHELVTIETGPHGFDGAVKAEDLDVKDKSQAARSLEQVVAFLARYL